MGISTSIKSPEVRIIEPFCNEADAAKFLQISKDKLKQMRLYESRRAGSSCPPFYKIGHQVRYRLSELLKWAAASRIGLNTI